MKRKLLTIVLALVLAFSLFACKDADAERKAALRKEINLEVTDDSNVAVPTYSETLTDRFVDTLIVFSPEMDDSFVEEFIYPLFKDAKMSESKINKILNYIETNTEKVMGLIPDKESLDDFNPEDIDYDAYTAILKGAFDVLDADDFGKLFYAFATTMAADMDVFENEVVDIIETLGRDNTIILSRFAFKLMKLSLEESSALYSSAASFVIVSPEGMDEVAMGEMFNLFKMQITAYNNIYTAITDAEIEKLIEIYATFAVPTEEKTALQQKYTGLIKDYRAIVNLGFKVVNKISKDDFVALLVGTSADGSESDRNENDESPMAMTKRLIDTALSAYDSLAASDKTIITKILKDACGDAQYFELNEDGDIITISETEVFNAGLFASDPISALRKLSTIMGKISAETKLTDEEQALFEIIGPFGMEMSYAIAVRLGIMEFVDGELEIGGFNKETPMPDPELEPEFKI